MDDEEGRTVMLGASFLGNWEQIHQGGEGVFVFPHTRLCIGKKDAFQPMILHEQ